MLGDLIEMAISKVGLTHDRIERWVGGECGCRERKEKLDALEAWARRVAVGKTQRAVEFLMMITGAIYDDDEVELRGDDSPAASKDDSAGDVGEPQGRRI